VNPLPPTSGQNQTSQIAVPRKIVFKETEPEEGSWSMPAYSEIFDYSSQGAATVLLPKAPSAAPYKPEPWIKQIPRIVTAPAPGRITGRSYSQEVVIEVGSVIPPYAQTFGYDSQADAKSGAWVPPPVKQIDIFTAQQTFPL
jgi:hypothetical protein